MDEKTIKAAESVLTKGDRWFRCPHCGQRTFKIKADTSIKNLEWVCKRCKQTIEVNT